jgi:hypothetical protein
LKHMGTLQKYILMQRRRGAKFTLIVLRFVFLATLRENWMFSK